MNPELIKKLKDSGYLGEFDLLSLIKACGNDFKSLWKEFDDNKWLVNCDYLGYGGIKGSTPEEAVAELYIKLHG